MTRKHIDFEVADFGELDHGPKPWAAYAQAVLDLAPVACWRLGETSGTTAADTADALVEHDGSYLNGVTLGRDGAIGRDADTAAGFDGQSAHIAIAHHPLLNLAGENPATWLMWARKTSPGNDNQRWPIGKGTPQSDQLRYMIELRGSTGSIHFITHDGDWHDVASNTGLAFDGWRFITITWDGDDTLTFYHDGQPVGTQAFQANWFPDTDDMLALGAARASAINNNLFHYAGDLDEVALFDTALTANQIADLHHRALGLLHIE